MSVELLEALKALADPFRLRMVAILRREELAVGELAQVMAVTQPRVSHHLKVLRECGLVQVRREGAWSFCQLVGQGGDGLAPGLLAAVEPWSGDLSPSREDLERLGRILEERRRRSRNFFDRAGATGATPPAELGPGLRHQALSLLLPRGLVLADIGCGAGYMTRALAARAERVILVDHAPAMLARARRELAGKVAATLEFRQGELDDLPLQAGEVDGAFVNLVLHHVPDLKRTMTELVKVLRPGGTLVVSDLVPHEEERLREEQADLRLGLDPEKLAALARQVGFAEVRTEEGVDRLRVGSGKAGKNGEKTLPLFLLAARKGDRC